MDATRRDFLKGAGVVAGLGAIAGASTLVGCSAPAEPEAFETRYEADVVVAGAGIGGLAAAVSAAEAGANVVLVEASAKVGGTSRFAAGAFGPRFGTDWDTVLAKSPMTDPVLGKFVVDNWDPYVEWITGLGLTTEPLGGKSAYLWMGGKRDAAQGSKSFTDEYLQQFGEIFADMGGTTVLNTRAIKLTTDNKGTVNGVICQDENGKFLIKSKAVILATGGWQCNKEMCTKYIGRHADLTQAQCVPYLDGAGIKMGVEVGAELTRSFGSFYGHPQPWPTTYLKGVDTAEGYEAVENVDDVHVLFYGTTEHSIQGLGVYLNCDGKRFVNEGLASSLVNQEITQQFMSRAYLILDEAVRNVIRETPFYNTAVLGGDRIDNMKKLGMPIVEADTLEDLVAKIKTETYDGVSFNATNALASVAEYNAAAKNGTAETMEIPHTGVVPAMPLENGPFYAIPVVGGIMATFGGLKINTATQVLSTAQAPIDGLYAIPGAAGGVMNGDYWCVMSGYSVFGRESGKQATDYAKSLSAE